MSDDFPLFLILFLIGAFSVVFWAETKEPQLGEVEHYVQCVVSKYDMSVMEYYQEYNKYPSC